MKETGRNDPCPCGSGKKYKHCCLGKAVATPPPLPQQTLQTAVAHHQAGRLDAAEALYRQMLQTQADHPDALHLLGMILRQRGMNKDAENLIRQAIQARPGDASYHNSLGIVLKNQDRLQEAVASYRRALSIKPEYAEAHANLGNALLALGNPGDAIDSGRNAVRLAPDFAEAHNNLGNALQAQGLLDEALVSYRRAIQIKPDYAEAHYNLGGVFRAQGLLEEAIASYRAALSNRLDYAEAYCNMGAALQLQGQLEMAFESCRRAVTLQLGYADAHYNLGNAYQSQGRLEEAISSYGTALEIRPDYAEALNNLGGVLQEQGKLGEAIVSFRQALILKPNHAEAYSNLGKALQMQGHQAEAIACCRKALELKPALSGAHSNLIFSLDLDSSVDTAMHQAERRRWHEAHAAALDAPSPHANLPDPERRLRIGYVSADFREHSARVVFGAMLTKFDPATFDVYAYSNSIQEDAQTRQFQNSGTCWRKIVGLPDEAVAELIRQDGIDILVDLSGHSAGNRLLTFARKPAPIQITAWGYVGGTGLKAIDVFFADPVVVPLEERQHYAEEIRYLPNFISAWFPNPFPDINPLPALNAGSVTFGSFNRLCKVSAEAYRTWAQVLRAVPGSRMIIKTGELNDAGMRDRVLDHFIRAGVDPARLILLGGTHWNEHMAAFNQIDLSLDPFPHGGGVTTLEGLMMGVPVVTLRWPTLPGRMSSSILTSLGLTDWIAETAEQYVGIAVQKAHDLTALAKLRQQLRPRFMASILGDNAVYVRAVEQEYRKLWREWCARQHDKTHK